MISSSSDDSSIRSSSFVPTSNEPPQREVEIQQKKRSGFKKSSPELKKQLFASMTSPLRSKIACVTPPQDQDETSEAVDMDLSAPSTTLSLIDTKNTKTSCSVRDIRYKSIHDMGKSCSLHFAWFVLVGTSVDPFQPPFSPQSRIHALSHRNHCSCAHRVSIQ